MSAITKTQQQEARDYLKGMDGLCIVPGDTIYTTNHGSNGTFIKLFVIKPSNGGEYRPFNITWYAARAMGIKPRDKDGSWMIHNPVYGMDRGFDLVYRLASTLFRDMDPDTIQKLSSNTSSANPGYLLRQEWL